MGARYMRIRDVYVLIIITMGWLMWDNAIFGIMAKV